MLALGTGGGTRDEYTSMLFALFEEEVVYCCVVVVRVGLQSLQKTLTNSFSVPMCRAWAET